MSFENLLAGLIREVVRDELASLRDDLRDPNRLLTEEEVAERYSVTPAAVEKWRRQGRLPWIKFGRKPLYRLGDLVELEERHRVLPGEWPRRRRDVR